MPERPRRQVVVHPRTRAAHGRRMPVSMRREIREQSAVGQVFLTSLMRSQRTLSIRVALTTLAVLAALPVVLRAMPAIERISVVGIPLQFVILAIGVFPVLTALAVGYVIRAERNERRFTEMMDDA